MLRLPSEQKVIPMKEFDRLKTHNGQKYAGMRVGQSHHWDYPNGTWNETKVAPDLWEFEFDCIKQRHVAAPSGSGAPTDTEYHWFVAADQRVRKVDANAYNTMMKGLKLKVGHKRPYWKAFSYEYPEQISEVQRKVEFLSQLIDNLKTGGMINGNRTSESLAGQTGQELLPMP